jgi:hypothetical protein
MADSRGTITRREEFLPRGIKIIKIIEMALRSLKVTLITNITYAYAYAHYRNPFSFA